MKGKSTMKQIDVSQFLMNRILPKDLTPEQLINMGNIIPRANKLLEAFGEFRKVNSGYRSPADQAKINPKAPKSMHLRCAAVDLEDKDGKLKQFIKDNPNLLEDLGLWQEAPESTPTWVHVQGLPPKSGNRVFIP